MDDVPPSSGAERRCSLRYEVEWKVDCIAEETFLYAAITNISQMGIFVACEDPFEVGTLLSLTFRTDSSDEVLRLPGRVQWVNRSSSLARSRNPGMGICFVELSAHDRERIVEAIHTIAYLRDYSN